MSWKRRFNLFTGTWEAECSVGGCESPSLILRGERADTLNSPVGFLRTCDAEGNLPNGWLYVPHVHGWPCVFCPEHVAEWKTYEKAYNEWDACRKANQKTFWLRFKARFVPEDPKPIMPFKGREG